LTARTARHLPPIVALVFVLALVPVALAAKGGGGGKPSSGDSISLAPSGFAVTGDGLPKHGDTVTFNITTTAPDRFANLQCVQNGVLVLNGWSGPVTTSWSVPLNSPAWQSGAADCTASLDTWTNHGWSVVTSTSFHVDA
jgi:hypothetical protein